MELINYFKQSLRHVSCVYRIVNTLTKDCYIGSASHVGMRFIQHKRQLENGKHHSIILQRAYDKYGENNFKMEILLVCSKKYLIYYEQLMMDELYPKYNILKKAGSSKGSKWSIYSKLNLSIKRKGKPNINRIGKLHTEDTKIKMSESRKGKFQGNNNPFYGKHHTEEAKDKIRQSRLGTSHSEETKKKMSETRKKKVKINNVIYDSLKDASESLGINKTTLSRWIKNNKLGYETYKE
jgi:group I intron endonuclease